MARVFCPICGRPSSSLRERCVECGTSLAVAGPRPVVAATRAAVRGSGHPVVRRAPALFTEGPPRETASPPPVIFAADLAAPKGSLRARVRDPEARPDWLEPSSPAVFRDITPPPPRLWPVLRRVVLVPEGLAALAFAGIAARYERLDYLWAALAAGALPLLYSAVGAARTRRWSRVLRLGAALILAVGLGGASLVVTRGNLWT